eukprot:5859784-Pyramimonas_sp.AAC.1
MEFRRIFPGTLRLLSVPCRTNPIIYFLIPPLKEVSSQDLHRQGQHRDHLRRQCRRAAQAVAERALHMQTATCL